MFVVYVTDGGGRTPRISAVTTSQNAVESIVRLNCRSKRYVGRGQRILLSRTADRPYGAFEAKRMCVCLKTRDISGEIMRSNPPGGDNSSEAGIPLNLDKK